MRMKKSSFVAAAVLCAASASLYAQDKSNITGSLYDNTATMQYVGIAAGKNAKASARRHVGRQEQRERDR